ncbi:hypothetical protein CBI30_06930 [Polynucleobacter aenigmaticus]|uniref:Uncharacterized protein n=1 Tax=Polynucleobacter aenigmaticus TaxID=1743164 RepID=A0A254PYY3_9BURK|nr:hypothetical protein [Polynucleobacter aenigmaticus]OWS71468.1 hypothetical protein CBI30_06930 [Polynucleobacter aenigmaticus]
MVLLTIPMGEIRLKTHSIDELKVFIGSYAPLTKQRYNLVDIFIVVCGGRTNQQTTSYLSPTFSLSLVGYSFHSFQRLSKALPKIAEDIAMGGYL